MTDASWDNGGMGRPAKRGWPLWGKVLAGCGVVVVVGLAACVGGIATCAGAVSKAGDSEWAAARAMVAQLGTDEGARAVYAANPGLAGRYPDEASFLQAVRGWRPRLEPLPEQKPGLTSGRVDMNLSIANGHRRVELNYVNGKGARLSTRWADGLLEDLRVE
jgi:hypothetical protein